MSELRDLFEGRSGVERRLGLAPGLSACDRAWPCGDDGWTALLRARALHPGSTHALMHRGAPTRSKAVERLLSHPESRWLLESRLAAWPLGADPILEGIDNPLSPEVVVPRSGLSLRGQIVGYKPLRRIVTRFEDSSGRARFFVKHLRKGQARRHAARHHLLERWAAGSPSLAVPTLHRANERPDFLVWSNAEGARLGDELVSDRALPSVVKAGRMLATLHQAPIAVTEVHSRESELAALDRWLAVTRALRRRPTALDSVFETLTATARHRPPTRPVLCHGDLHDGQILIGSRATTLLDTDTLALGEPELDLGNLIAHFDLLRLTQPRTENADLAESLLTAYGDVRSLDPNRELIHWYRTLSAARLACVHSARSATRHLEDEIADWTEELHERVALNRGNNAS